MYFFIFLILCVFAAVFGQCPEGQKEYECKPCTQTCSTDITHCQRMCVKGCACPINTITDASGKCVDPATCPLACTRENEIFYGPQKCKPNCHQTCASYLAEGRTPQACTEQCISNTCGCPEENLLDADGNCLTEEECKELESCAPGQYFYANEALCVPCERQCNDYYESNVMCAMECATNVCGCAPDYVRNPEKDAMGCIPADQCPINDKCGKNAMLPWDGLCEPCERTCDNFYKEDVPCMLDCKQDQCVCKEGFVRNADKECVATNDCPTPTCGTGERYYGANECRPCEDRCSKLSVNPMIPYCTKICVSNVCGCKEGFKRNAENSCIEACPAA